MPDLVYKCFWEEGRRWDEAVEVEVRCDMFGYLVVYGSFGLRMCFVELLESK